MVSLAGQRATARNDFREFHARPRTSADHSADGWGDLDIACVHDRISGQAAVTQEEPS